jgi:transcriptional regulator with XRE-family HTH domain
MTSTVFAWDTDQMPRRPPAVEAGPDEWAAWRVRYERERRNWSQGELARQITTAGVPMQQQAVWKIENGDPPRKISYGEAIAFCRVFGIENVADLGQPPESLITREMHGLIDEVQELSALRSKLIDQAKTLKRRVLRLSETSRSTGSDGDDLSAMLTEMVAAMDVILAMPHPEPEDIK